MSISSPPRLFDRTLYAARRNRAEAAFAQGHFLRQRVIEDTLLTLSAINRHFELALDMSAGDGDFARAVADSEVAGKIGLLIQGDIAERLLAEAGGPRVVLDAEALPFGDETLNLVLDTLGLHAVNDLPGLLVQVRRALKPDGLFIGTLFGGETLKELRGCLMEAEIEVRGGYGPRIAPFAEAPDLIDLLRRTGFNMPVVDSDRVTVSYDNPVALMRDLRSLGEGNVLIDRPRKGLNRAILMRASQLYAERFTDAEGRITATFEIITLSAWKPHESQQKPLRPGSAKTRLADALGVREGKL